MPINHVIFTRDDICTICRAKSVVAGDETDMLEWYDLLDSEQEEVLEKIDLLPQDDKDEFMEQVDVVVAENLPLFSSVPEHVITDDDFEEHQAILKETADNWLSALHEYIKEDD